MKYIFLLSLLFFGCKTNLQTDYQWIRTWSESTLAGASAVVKEKGDKKWDVEMLTKMKTASLILNNTLDSISQLSKGEVLERAQLLIDELESEPTEIKKFYNLDEQSSDEDFKLQLALLEFELLNYYVRRIGLMDITFDRMELRFVPTEANKSRAIGELLFAASSDNLEREAKMFINNKEIEIDGRVGLVDIPLTELSNGKVTAKIKFNNLDFEYEEEIEIIRD